MTCVTPIHNWEIPDIPPLSRILTQTVYIQYVTSCHNNDPRTAIEAQLLGCRTVVVEGRTGFTRNNVLKLWKFLIEVGFLLFSTTFTSPTCCRTWSSWGWRNCTASSVLETSTTSASKPFRCINRKHVLQCHASDRRQFNCNTNIFRQPCWKYAACSEYRWLLS